FRWENSVAIKFLHQFAGTAEIAGSAAIFRDRTPGELQPIGMFVDRSNKRVDVTAAVPKLKKLAFFFRFHCDQVRIGVEKFAEGGPKFFGVQLRKIDEGQIMFAESELPDNLARRRIAQLGGKHNRAEDIFAFWSRAAQSLTPCHQSKVRPHAQPDETLLQRNRLRI